MFIEGQDGSLYQSIIMDYIKMNENGSNWELCISIMGGESCLYSSGVEATTEGKRVELRDAMASNSPFFSFV